MYGEGNGAGLASIVPTVGGITMLPNTGDNTTLFIVSLFSTIVGSLILVSTLARFVAKKFYRA